MTASPFVECGADAFKTYEGNAKCEKCTENSIATYDRRTCQCIEGFYKDKGKCFGKMFFLSLCVRLLNTWIGNETFYS